MGNPLTGAWQLERWSARLPDGSLAAPFGETPQGVLVYTVDGTMCSAFMNSSRKPIGEQLAACRRYWQGLRKDAPPGESDVKARLLQAAMRFNSYAGRYAVEGDRVHHSVEVALLPDWIGMRLTRRFRFEEGKLALSFESLGQEDTLTWSRR